MPRWKVLAADAAQNDAMRSDDPIPARTAPSFCHRVRHRAHKVGRVCLKTQTKLPVEASREWDFPMSFLRGRTLLLGEWAWLGPWDGAMLREIGPRPAGNTNA